METNTRDGMPGGMDRKAAGTATEASFGAARTHELDVLGHLMAGGEMLAAQQGSPSNWSPEKRLAAAVFASALVEIRDHHGDPSYRRRVTEDLDWVFSDEEEWPFSFLGLCALMDVEARWVREVVARWVETPLQDRERPGSPYRQAA